MPQAEGERGLGRDRRVETRSDAGEAAARLDRAELDANTMADRALQAELFQLYFEQAPVYFGRMRAAIADRTGDEWRKACHGVKGTARTLGFMRLAEASAAAEYDTPCADRLKHLERLLEDAQAAAREYLADA